MKKHESWSDFAQFDGVIPLFDKNMNKENPNRPSVLRVKIQNHGFWSSIFVLMQLKIMRLISCFNTLSHGLKQSGKYFRYRVKLFRSRNILNLNVKRSGNSLNLGNNNNEVLNKDVNSILDDNVALSENTPQARAENTNLGNLKQFNTVNCSPIRMAKLQRVDSDLGVIIQWLEENRRPPRDKGAGYSPILSRFGLCLDIHSDQGTNYQSKLFREVCRILEINQSRTSGYRPMANGGPERYNQVLQNMITTYSDQTNWDENLNLTTSAYRGCVH